MGMLQASLVHKTTRQGMAGTGIVLRKWEAQQEARQLRVMKKISKKMPHLPLKWEKSLIIKNKKQKGQYC